jgi:predicted phosphodiesterase
VSTDEMTSKDEAFGGVTAVQAQRVGVIGDDHNAEESGESLPDAVLQVFEGVDLILHLGHMGDYGVVGHGVLDRLEAVAPVLGVRDFSSTEAGDRFLTPGNGSRVRGLTRVVEAGGLRIGAVHNLASKPGPEIPTPPGGVPNLADPNLPATVAEKFGGPVDVIAFAGTHRPVTLLAQGILFVNPGSPRYPKGPGWQKGEPTPGTVGILHLDGGVPAFEVIELTRHRFAPVASSASADS